MAHSPSTPEPARDGDTDRAARRADIAARFALDQPQQCLSARPGHVVSPGGGRFAASLGGGVPAVAHADADGQVTVISGGQTAVYWNHRPDRILTALEAPGAQVSLHVGRRLLIVDLPRGRRELFSLATLHDSRTCIHIPPYVWHRAGTEGPAQQPRRGQRVRDRRAGVPYRLVMRHPGREVEMYENPRMAPLIHRLEDRTGYAPATDARLWSPRGRLLIERVNYWAAGRLVGSGRWFSLFPPRTGIARVLGEIARYRPLADDREMAEFRIAVGGYDGRVIGRLSPAEAKNLRPVVDAEQSVLPGMEVPAEPKIDFFSPGIW